MEQALTALARGRMHQPLRMIVRPEGAEGLMALMPAYRSGERAAYGLKAICVFHENPTRGLDAHQGCVMLFSGETGELLAVMNASAITAVRTAAVSGAATRRLARGAHINAVGTYSPDAREIDTATVAAASLFVDRRESALSEAGDYILAAREGAIGPEHIRAELGEVLAGERPGRTSPDEITLFKSLGLAVEDLAAAEYLQT